MSDARIVDQGYRPYDGPRLGVRGAIRSLAWHSVLRALGMRRTAWAKLLPIASIGIAYLPAAVFVGVAALLPDRVQNQVDIIPTYAEYYGFITAAIVLFVAIVGPEVLCPDRRNGMLGLYLASPLDRRTYLLAKVLAVVPVLALVTLGPPLLQLVGLTLADSGPGSASEFLIVFLRIGLAGIVISAAFTALSMAAASLTDRRAVASAGLILLLFATSVGTTQLVDVGGADPHVLLTNLFFLPFELVQRVYGEPGAHPSIATSTLAAAEAAWVLVGASVVWLRYKSLLVTR
jgi:ABC-2 type transport system permease protein